MTVALLVGIGVVVLLATGGGSDEVVAGDTDDTGGEQRDDRPSAVGDGDRAGVEESCTDAVLVPSPDARTAAGDALARIRDAGTGRYRYELDASGTAAGSEGSVTQMVEFDLAGPDLDGVMSFGSRPGEGRMVVVDGRAFFGPTDGALEEIDPDVSPVGNLSDGLSVIEVLGAVGPDGAALGGDVIEGESVRRYCATIDAKTALDFQSARLLLSLDLDTAAVAELETASVPIEVWIGASTAQWQIDLFGSLDPLRERGLLPPELDAATAGAAPLTVTITDPGTPVSITVP